MARPCLESHAAKKIPDNWFGVVGRGRCFVSLCRGLLVGRLALCLHLVPKYARQAKQARAEQRHIQPLLFPPGPMKYMLTVPTLAAVTASIRPNSNKKLRLQIFFITFSSLVCFRESNSVDQVSRAKPTRVGALDSFALLRTPRRLLRDSHCVLFNSSSFPLLSSVSSR